MISAIIIDDELHCTDSLNRLINNCHADSVHVTAICNSYEEGVAAIRKIRPEVVFLDIQLDHRTGIDLLKEFNPIDFNIIFVTAYEQYAVQAFQLSAIDYLVKPVDPDSVQRAIVRVQEKISGNDMSAKFDTLLHNIKNIKGRSKRLCIPVVSGLELIEVDDIIRLEGRINYTFIYLKNKEKLLVSRTLKEFETILANYEFFRVHNSHLVNLNYIKNYKKRNGGTVHMQDGSEVEVSARRKADFLMELTKLNRRL